MKRLHGKILPWLRRVTWSGRLGNPPRGSHLSYHVNAMRDFMDKQVIPAKRVTPGVPHLHVNKPVTLGRVAKSYSHRGTRGAGMMAVFPNDFVL